jgi:hypothetical protein
MRIALGEPSPISQPCDSFFVPGVMSAQVELLAVNAGVPLLFLVTIAALMFRHLMLAN